MPIREKKILIIDEHGFSRICSAILHDIVGYDTEIIAHGDDLPSKLNNDKLRLIVTSYPYGAFLFDEIKKRNIPTIILSDSIDGELIALLNDFDKSYCMIKPLDYDKFKTLVKQVVNGEPMAQGGRSVA
jgi:DNA-binding NtrC family response regulator